MYFPKNYKMPYRNKEAAIWKTPQPVEEKLITQLKTKEATSILRSETAIVQLQRAN